MTGPTPKCPATSMKEDCDRGCTLGARCPRVPRRVQLRRTKGWRMPENTVKVTRPGRWGNPWPIGKPGPDGRIAPDADGAVGMFRDMLSDPEMRALAGYPDDLSPLRGKNLACWCPLGDEPCHADVLLEIANGEARQ